MNSETAEEPNAKILFRVESDDDDSTYVETLWAYNLGDDMFRLDNFPYYAYGVSWHDVVYAPHDPDEQRATFKHVVSKSGNRTIRIIFEKPVENGNESQELLDNLVEIGCSFERANTRFIAVNIPPLVDLGEVVEILDQANEDVGWEHADPTYEELYPNGEKDDE
jgi:hypothetical protein